MFGTSFGQRRAAAYQQVEVQTGVTTADPHKLVLMLYDGAIMAITSAEVAMQNKQIATKGESVSKAIEIITNGLKVSLNLEQGGELAERLAALYDYLCDRLIYANLHNNQAALEEVKGLLVGLREAWQQIAPGAGNTAATGMSQQAVAS